MEDYRATPNPAKEDKGKNWASDSGARRRDTQGRASAPLSTLESSDMNRGIPNEKVFKNVQNSVVQGCRGSASKNVATGQFKSLHFSDVKKSRIIQGNENRTQQQHPSYSVSISVDMIRNSADVELLNSQNDAMANNFSQSNMDAGADSICKMDMKAITHVNLRYVPRYKKGYLQHPPIGKISALENVPNLRFLDLSGNIIRKMENIHMLRNLRILNLAENEIVKLENFEYLTSLERLNVTGNNIEHIPAEIQKLKYLVSLRLERNKIKNISEVMHLCHLHNLVTFTFRGNPCASSAHSNLFIVYQLRFLDTLDGQNVSLMTKKKARETFENQQIEHLTTKLKLEQVKAKQMEVSVRSARKEASDVKTLAKRTLQDLLYRETVLGKKLEAKDALLEKKTDALVRANEIVSGLEQQLAFSKIDDPFYTKPGISGRQDSKFMTKEATDTSYQDELGVRNTNLATKGLKVSEENNAHIVHKDDHAVLTKKSLGSLLHRMDLSPSLNGDNTSVNYTSSSDEGNGTTWHKKSYEIGTVSQIHGSTAKVADELKREKEKSLLYQARCKELWNELQLRSSKQKLTALTGFEPIDLVSFFKEVISSSKSRKHSLSAMERYISFLKLNERELQKSLSEAKEKSIHYQADDKSSNIAALGSDSNVEYLRSCEVLHGAISHELKEAQIMLLAMHESREKETQLKNQLEAATLELERQNKEKDDAIERAKIAENLSQSYLEMLEDTSYMAGGKSTRKNNESSENKPASKHLASSISISTQTQHGPIDAAINNECDSSLEDEMEMELLGISDMSNELGTSKLSKNSLSTSKIAVADSLVINRLKQEAEEYKMRLEDAEKTIFKLEYAIEKQQNKHREELIAFRELFDKTEAEFWRKIKFGQKCMNESEKIIESLRRQLRSQEKAYSFRKSSHSDPGYLYKRNLQILQELHQDQKEHESTTSGKILPNAPEYTSDSAQGTFLPKSINEADANATKPSPLSSKEKMRSDIGRHETDNSDKQSIDLLSFKEEGDQIAKLERKHVADINDILTKHETEKLGYVTKISSLLQQIDDLSKKAPSQEDKISDIRMDTLSVSTNTSGCGVQSPNGGDSCQDVATMTDRLLPHQQEFSQADYMQCKRRVMELEQALENQNDILQSFYASKQQKDAFTRMSATSLKTTSTDSSDLRFDKKITEDVDEEKGTIAELNERIEHLKDSLGESQKAHIEGMQELNALKAQYATETQAIDELVLTYEEQINTLKTELAQVKHNHDEEVLRMRDEGLGQSIAHESLNSTLQEITAEMKGLKLTSKALQERLFTLTTDLNGKYATLKSVEKSMMQKEGFINDINHKLQNMQENYSIELDTKNARIDQHKKEIVKLNESIVTMRKKFDDQLRGIVESSTAASTEAYNILAEQNRELQNDNAVLSKRLNSTVETLKALESTLDNVQNKASSEAEKQGVLEQNLRSAKENLVLIRQRVVSREENLSNAQMESEELRTRLEYAESQHNLFRKTSNAKLNERINEIETLKKKQAETSNEISQMRTKLATLQAEKESSTVLHEDEIQSYKFDLEHIQEDYKLLGATKDDLKSSIALHKKDLLSLNQQKEKIAMDIKIALVNISDLQQCKEVMCNEIKNYSQDFAVRELEHNQLIRKMEEKLQEMSRANALQQDEIKTLKDKSSSEQLSMETLQQQNVEMKAKYEETNKTRELSFNAQKIDDDNCISHLKKANGNLQEHLNILREDHTVCKRQLAELRSHYGVEVKRLTSEIEVERAKCGTEKEQHDVRLEQCKREISTLHVALKTRDQLLEDMTSTKDILNADAKKYMEDLKAFETKYKEVQRQVKDLNKKLKDATTAKKEMELEKIVVSDSVKDLEEKLQNRERMQVETLKVANTKVKELIASNEEKNGQIDKLKEEKEILTIECNSKNNTLKRLEDAHENTIRVLKTKMESENEGLKESIRQCKEMNTKLNESFVVAEKALLAQNKINSEVEAENNKQKDKIIALTKENNKIVAEYLDAKATTERLTSKLVLLQQQVDDSSRKAEKIVMLQESLDVANREIKAGKAENTNVKAAKKQEAHHHRTIVESLKERIEILESTSSSRMLEEQLKLVKETHASNILALKGKITEQKKDIENLLSSEKLLKAQQVDEKKEMLRRKELDEGKLSTELKNAQKALLAREEELESLRERFWEATTKHSQDVSEAQILLEQEQMTNSKISNDMLELNALIGTVFKSVASSSVRLIPCIPLGKDKSEAVLLRNSLNNMQAIARSSSSDGDGVSSYVSESLKSMQTTFSDMVGFVVKKDDENKSKIKRCKDVELQLKQELQILKSQYDAEAKMKPVMVSTAAQISSNTGTAAVQATPVHIAKGTSTLNGAYLKYGVSTQTRVHKSQNVSTNTEPPKCVTRVDVETETPTHELVDASTQGTTLTPLSTNRDIGVQTMLMSTTETASVGTATILEPKSSIQLQTDDKEVCSVGSQWEEERSFKNAGVSTTILKLIDTSTSTFTPLMADKLVEATVAMESSSVFVQTESESRPVSTTFSQTPHVAVKSVATNADRILDSEIDTGTSADTDFPRNKKNTDVATGTAKVELIHVSSQAKHIIETIDNACNTDSTPRRDSQTETLKLLTSDMAVETMPFREVKNVSMVDASCATRSRSLLSIGTQYDVDQAPQNILRKTTSSTQANFVPIEKNSNTGVMIDKATCATTEKTDASTMAIDGVENKVVDVGVQSLPSSYLPVSTQTQGIKQNEAASNTVHRLSKDVGQNTDKDSINTQDDFQVSINPDALDNSITSNSENSSFNYDFNDDVLVLRERMLAAEDALRLEIENRKSAEEKLKTSAGSDVGPVQASREEKIDASSNTDIKLHEDASSNTDIRLQGDVESISTSTHLQMNDAFSNTEHEFNLEEKEEVISVSVINMVDASTAVDETSRSCSGTNTDESWWIAKPPICMTKNENIQDNTRESKKIVRNTESKLPTSSEENEVAMKIKLEHGSFPAPAEIETNRTNFDETTDQYMDTIPPPPPYEKDVVQDRTHDVMEVETVGTYNARSSSPIAKHHEVDIPPPPPFLSEDDADDVTRPVLHVKEDQMNMKLHSNGEKLNSEYKNSSAATAKFVPSTSSENASESSNCEENDAMVEERNAILSELQLYEESGDFLVNTQDSPVILRENIHKNSKHDEKMFVETRKENSTVDSNLVNSDAVSAAQRIRDHLALLHRADTKMAIARASQRALTSLRRHGMACVSPDQKSKPKKSTKKKTQPHNLRRRSIPAKVQGTGIRSNDGTRRRVVASQHNSSGKTKKPRSRKKKLYRVNQRSSSEIHKSSEPKPFQNEKYDLEDDSITRSNRKTKPAVLTPISSNKIVKRGKGSSIGQWKKSLRMGGQGDKFKGPTTVCLHRSGSIEISIPIIEDQDAVNLMDSTASALEDFDSNGISKNSHDAGAVATRFESSAFDSFSHTIGERAFLLRQKLKQQTDSILN